MMNRKSQSQLLFGANDKAAELEILLAAVNSSLSGIIITDNEQSDNPIVFCNDAFERISGYKKQEIIGRNCRFLQGDDRNQEARQKLRDAVENGKSVKVDIRNYRKDGTLFHNELYMSPVKSGDGKVRFFIGVQNDVTRRKNAEETLVSERAHMEEELARRTKHIKENEEYLASIIETVRESLIVLSPEFEVLSVNEHFLRAFKVSPQETKGRRLFDLGNGQWNIEALKMLLNQVLPTSNPVIDFEVEHDFPHIGTKLMLLNAYRVELEGKYKDRILIAIEDITDRRAGERRKDDFLSIASHELKTPLTSIKGYVQLAGKLTSSNKVDKLPTVLEKAQKSIARLDNLILELLDVSRMQSGLVSLEFEETDFDKMVTDAIQEFKESNPGREITFTGTTGVHLMVDESHLVQVMVNLLSNAVKYSPDSSTINVEIGIVGDYVKFSVTDFGLGITMDDQKHIFERFFRVQNVQTKYPGMGIGLYICDHIIRNHKGMLWVDSVHGKGSTFSFTIPINETHEKKKDSDL